jgi:DNA-binding response OmpR family regulator
MSKKHLLLIDDDEKMSEVLVEYLRKFDYEVTYQSNPLHGLDYLDEVVPDLVILDIMMPEKNGLEVCRELRQKSSVPVIFLSARGETMDRIVGLEVGADDYLPKPFEPRELVARIETVLRRVAEVKDKNEESKGIFLNSKLMQVTLNGEKIEFTANEFQALNYLYKNQGKIVSRDELLTFIQGFDSEVYGRSIDVLISRIRQKLNDDPKDPSFIITVRGQGYRYLGGNS